MLDLNVISSMHFQFGVRAHVLSQNMDVLDQEKKSFLLEYGYIGMLKFFSSAASEIKSSQ